MCVCVIGMGGGFKSGFPALGQSTFAQNQTKATALMTTVNIHTGTLTFPTNQILDY